MAIRYIYSGAGGAATGADWANAHLTMAAAITASTAGDVFYVAHDHAESTASAVTLTFKGGSLTQDNIYCVDRTGSVPPVAADLRTTGSITTTGNSNLFVAGGAYIYGLIFNAGTGAVNAALRLGDVGTRFTCERCTFNVVATGSGAAFQPTGTSAAGRFVTLINCDISFGATGQSINNFGIRFHWLGGTLLAGAAIPTNLFSGASNTSGEIIVDGVDLSAAGSGKTLMPGGISGPVIFRNCKINASVTLAGTPSQNSFGRTQFIGCHSSGNIQRNEYYQHGGPLTTETTIVRTAGASDGTTPYSWKIVSNANAKQLFPIETFEGALWNDDTGSAKTLTVHVVTDNVTLTDAEIWLEVDYLGNGSFPISTKTSDAAATPLTAGSNQTSDSGESWTTTGLTTPVKQKLEVAFTPALKGPIRWCVKFAKPSTTVYICPKPDLT